MLGTKKRWTCTYKVALSNFLIRVMLRQTCSVCFVTNFLFFCRCPKTLTFLRIFRHWTSENSQRYHSHLHKKYFWEFSDTGRPKTLSAILLIHIENTGFMYTQSPLTCLQKKRKKALDGTCRLGTICSYTSYHFHREFSFLHYHPYFK